MQILAQEQAYHIAQVARRQPVTFEVFPEGGHQQHLAEIAVDFRDVIQHLPLPDLLQNQGYGVGPAPRGGAQQFPHAQRIIGQAENFHRHQAPLRMASEVVPEIAPPVATVQNDQRPAPPAFPAEAAAADAAQGGQGKNGGGPTAQNDQARIQVPGFCQKKRGQDHAIRQADHQEEGFQFAVRRQADALVQAQACAEQRPQQQKRQHPAVKDGVKIVKSRTQQKNRNGRAQQGQKVGQHKQNFLRRQAEAAQQADGWRKLGHD